ncbi:MAG: acyl-CoA thioesterase [bacterium]|jgi:acyl-CoA hydrolase|nr:acyl-CoA thioesterase [bacterium]
MEHHLLVRPEHLNQYGFLFGGYLLMWVDETAWIAASLDYPGCRFVTVAMNRVEFRHNVRAGSLLKLDIRRARQGRTSVDYDVLVVRAGSEGASPTGSVGGAAIGEEIFATTVTFVRVDAEGRKQPLPC